MERLFMIPFRARPQHHEGCLTGVESGPDPSEFGSFASGLSVAAGALVLAILLRPLPAQGIPLEMLKRLEQEQVRATKGAAEMRPNTEAPPVLMQSDAAAVSLAQQLRQGGATFYGTFWCPACDAQRQLFGLPAWQSVPYVECDARNSSGQPKRCAEAGVDAIPFWTFADGSTHAGVMSVSDLESRVNSSQQGDKRPAPSSTAVQLPMPSDCKDCKIGEGKKN
mmetsp:Transcript_79819/g.97735  ORF Transcript_79819/g.97735 Transcript_79819/m.97735 type:complete len:223 (+) Transcript_79819:2-670(+)